MKTINSRSNEEIKVVSSLHDSKGRKELKQFIAQGKRTCGTLIENEVKIVQLYVTQEHLTDAQDIIGDYFITVVNDQVMEKISTTITPSGIVAVFEMPKEPSFSDLKAGLVLAQIHDPGNMGTLIRTAAALAIPNVIIVEGADVWSPKVVQATAGALAQVKIYTPSWDTLVKWKKDLRLCALVVKGGKKPQELDSKNMLLIVGNEATGIAKEWLRDCNDYMTIPMPGKTESLNAAVAGSIGMYLAFANPTS